MSVVVTGASGFIAGHVIAALHQRGVHVVGIDRRSGSPADEHLVADLTDGDETVRAALRNADAVIHLAGCPGVRDDRPDVGERRYRDNVVATEVVCSLTPRRTSLVLASSSSVYGGSVEGRASHEDDRLDPKGGYARSKVAAEAVAHARADAGGRTVVVRPFTVAGEGQRPDMALTRWLLAARTREPLTILGSLDRVRDVTDVRDVARGIVRATDLGEPATINLGTGTPLRLQQLVDAVGSVTRRPLELRVVPAATVEVPATRADTARCASLLGFTPTTDLVELVRRQDAALRSTHHILSPRSHPLHLEVV